MSREVKRPSRSSQDVPPDPTDISKPLVTRAATPFDDVVRGDMILRASDNVDFVVMKMILALASPVFESMLSLPQPSDKDNPEDPPPMPVIPVSEPSTTLDPLLRFCYPVEPPDLDGEDVSLTGKVLQAALKYEITAAISPTQESLMRRLSRDEGSALGVYAIACSLKLGEEARAAANECLRWPVLRILVPQFDGMSGTDCFNLLDFHRRAGEAAAGLFDEVVFLETTCKGFYPRDHRSHECPTESINFGGYFLYLPKWWVRSKSAMANSVKLAPLDSSKLTLSCAIPGIESHACVICRNAIFCGWESTKVEMMAAIRKKVAKEKLALSWE